ncbi:MAG: transglutaminase-like domain-containing protein [Myxococcota bacterium]
MKLFDIVGGLAVAGWLVLTGLYVYRAEFQDATTSSELDSALVMKEGETWLTLRRENEDVGFVHQTRTRLQEGWLLEYDLVMAISLLGSDRAIETNVKATLDDDGYLEKFNADISAGDNTFAAQGRVEGTTLTLNIDLGMNPQQRIVELQEPPRLSSSAVNQLLATNTLEPGETFEESYFDPTTMKMTSMALKYVGKKEVEILDETRQAHHVKQRMSGNELDVYVDDDGEILIQEFPLRMIGMRVPPEFGKTRAASLRRRLDAMKDKKKTAQANGFDLSLDTALNLIGGASDKEAVEDKLGADAQAGRYVVEGVNDEMELKLTSRRQTVRSLGGEKRLIRTDLRGDADYSGEPAADLERYLASGPRVDADSDAIAKLVSTAGEKEPGAIASAVADSLDVAGEAGISTASSALARGQGDCTEHALVLVAALRNADIPARFASGVLHEDDKMTPHQWVQYYDDGAWRELDITRDNMRVGTRHIQLYTHATPEHSGYVHALDQLQIQPAVPAGDVDDIDDEQADEKTETPDEADGTPSEGTK